MMEGTVRIPLSDYEIIAEQAKLVNDAKRLGKLIEINRCNYLAYVLIDESEAIRKIEQELERERELNSILYDKKEEAVKALEKAEAKNRVSESEIDLLDKILTTIKSKWWYKLFGG